MQKSYWIILGVLIAFISVAFAAPSSIRRPSSSIKVAPIKGEALGELVMRILTIVRPDLSMIKKQVLARTFVRVATDVLETEDQGRSFAILVAIESKYNADVVSPAGAIGMSQLMIGTAKQFAPMCGIKEFSPEDLKDPEINLTIGACVFRYLLGAFHGNLAETLVAYNAGMASTSLKQLQALSNITNDETPRYVTRFMFLDQTLKPAKL